MINGIRNWRLRHWIIVGYTIPVLGLIISASVTVFNLKLVNQRSVDLDLSRTIQDKIEELMINVQMGSRAVRGYMLDKDPSTLESFQTSQDRAIELDSELLKLARDVQQRERLQKLDSLLDDLNRSNQILIDLVNQNKVEEAISTWKLDGGGRQQIEEVTALLNTIQENEGSIVERSQEQEEDSLDSLQFTVLAATISSLLLSTLIGFVVISRTSFRMNTSANAIASSSSEIASTVEQQERTTSQQAASVNETTTTMEELSASSRQSAEQAEASAAGARQALSLAGNGTKAVERTLEGMENLKLKVAAIAEQILRLSEQTSQIGNISNLVSDLANQTNMLALNAAVEAVRAGEHGKGFSVVASEIRKLADQSKNSADKISTLVTDIQNAINATVMATDEGTKTVEEGVRVAQDTADSFAGVADAVNNVVLNNQQISLNIKQQAIAIQQVVEAMNSLNIAAKETATGITQIRVGTHRLNDAAQTLKAIV